MAMEAPARLSLTHDATLTAAPGDSSQAGGRGRDRRLVPALEGAGQDVDGRNEQESAQGGVASQGRRRIRERTAEGRAGPVPLVGSRDMDVQVDANAQDQLGDEHHAEAQAGPAQPGAPVRVWLLRCPLPGGVLAGRWLSVRHGRTASWVAFR
jgi:hypothetical protein